MAAIDFTKYHGTGNDFILIDNRREQAILTSDDIAWLCHRRLGIGADGLMLLLPSADHDFEMKYYNADGKEGSMCGNGGRCITAFASDIGLTGEVVRFQAIDGSHEARITRDDGAVKQVEVQLNDVQAIHKLDDSGFLLDTGSPHYVKFVPDLDKMDALKEGKRIRWEKRFQPEGINVNFVQRSSGRLSVITYERGVEDITLSCGTGVTACGIAASAGDKDGPVSWTIQTPGGDLEVTFVKNNELFTNIWLKGPAEKVFAGTVTR